jgi:bacteriocin-like protein
MNKTLGKKLTLSKETVETLTDNELAQVLGACLHTQSVPEYTGTAPVTNPCYCVCLTETC